MHKVNGPQIDKCVLNKKVCKYFHYYFELVMTIRDNTIHCSPHPFLTSFIHSKFRKFEVFLVTVCSWTERVSKLMTSMTIIIIITICAITCPMTDFSFYMNHLRRCNGEKKNLSTDMVVAVVGLVEDGIIDIDQDLR